MGKIQASMQLIPRQVKIALQVLGSRRATNKIISMLLPSTLREIERLGKSCVTLANSTHVSFAAVMDLIGEVISTTETTRGLQETKLRQTEIELNASRIMKDEMSKLGETIRAHYQEARESARKAQEEYSRALRKIPTGFRALLFDLGRAVISVAEAAGHAYIAYSTGGASTLNGLANKPGSKPGGNPGGNSGGNPEAGTTIGTSQVLTYGRLFSDGLSKGIPRINKILDNFRLNKSTQNDPAQELEAFKIAFGAVLSQVENTKANSFQQPVLNVIKRGISAVDESTQLIKRDFNTSDAADSAVESLKNDLNKVAHDAKEFAAAEQYNGGNVPPAAAPSGSGGMGDSSQNEKFVAQLSLDRLKSAETRYDKLFEQLKQNQEDIAKLMGKIATLDMQRIQYKEILEMLREALHLLARVREQWGQLVLFFAQVAAQAEIALSGTLNPFIAQAEQAGSASLSAEERLFYLDILKSQAQDIDSKSQMLYVMSRTYVDMSSNFIMGRLAGLSKMLLARDDIERNHLLAQLNAESQASQQAVMNLVTQRKVYYQNSVQKRRAELEDFLAKLGGPDADNQAAIEAGKLMLENKSSNGR